MTQNGTKMLLTLREKCANTDQKKHRVNLISNLKILFPF